nr:uncharacterized protein LOC129281156 [Lytechinus pictus]
MTSTKASRKTSQVRVILWTFPRTRSTALTKCLSQIEGVEIWFEPYCFCSMAATEYRRVHGRELPTSYRGNETMFAEAARLVSKVALMPPGVLDPERLAYEGVKERLERSMSRYVIVKDMAFALSDEKYRRFLPDGFAHAFLIRDPIAAIASYRRASYSSFKSAGYLDEDATNESKFDVERDNFLMNAGLFHKELCDLWNYLMQSSKTHSVPDEESSGPHNQSVVIDSDDLLTKPDEVLPKFCEALGLPYDQSFLRWDPSADVAFSWKAAGDELLRGNVHFYETAMASSCFMPAKERERVRNLTKDVLRLAEQARPFYDQMYNNKL